MGLVVGHDLLSELELHSRGVAMLRRGNNRGQFENRDDGFDESDQPFVGWRIDPKVARIRVLGQDDPACKVGCFIEGRRRHPRRSREDARHQKIERDHRDDGNRSTLAFDRSHGIDRVRK